MRLLSGLLLFASLAQGHPHTGSDSTPTSYNCSLPGLEWLTPGKYEGVVGSYLSFVTDISSPYFVIRAKEFENCVGGRIMFAEGNNVFIDPIEDLGTRGKFGLGVHDAYFMSSSHFPEASALDLAETLNDRLRASQEQIEWEDVFPQVRAMGQYRKDGKNNLDFLMFDGDFFVPVIRVDLLEKHNMPLPNTWTEALDIARFFHGKDLNEDGVPDYGFCHFPFVDTPSWGWWWPELIYGTWASFAQRDSEGFFFDPELFTPNVDTEPFRRAARVWKELNQYSAEGCVSPNFATGRCALGFSPPGCWKGIFLNGVARTDSNGTVLWRPTLANGEYAEPYRLQPFGSTDIYDPDTKSMATCTLSLCPKAKRIDPRGHTGPNDRITFLPASPLEGQFINRAPFFWSGGLGTLIRRSAEPIVKDMMWDFFVYINSPATSVNDVAAYSSWIDSWRYKQLTEAGDNFVLHSTWSPAAYAEHRSVMIKSLGEGSNGALNLRLPGIKEYTYEVLSRSMLEFISNNLTEDQFVAEVVSGWKDVTMAQGLIYQLQTYRAGLSMEKLGDAKLCQLHRSAMDTIDPSTCRQFDPKEDTIYLIVLIVCGAVLAVLTVGAFLLWVAWTVRSKRRLLMENKKRMKQRVKESLDCIGTLKYPMVLVECRTFYGMGHFVMYEALRDMDVANLEVGMKVIDLYQDLAEFLTAFHVIFLSHQWLGWGEPDPETVQYHCAVRSVKKLVKEKNWDQRKVYVWCDYMSIPQRCASVQTLAISSLPVYASKVSAFIVIAPTTQHAETGLDCSVDTYSRRAWCRAEILSHALCKGMKNMYIADEAGMVSFGGDSSQVLDSVYVFEGELSCCRMKHRDMEVCDKEKLVVPFLGLYSYVIHTLLWKKDDMDKGTKEFFDRIIAEKSRIFPESFVFNGGGKPEQRNLFRGLLGLMEKEVEETAEEHFEDFRAHVADPSIAGISHRSSDGRNSSSSVEGKPSLEGMAAEASAATSTSNSMEASPKFRPVDREDSQARSLPSLAEVHEVVEGDLFTAKVSKEPPSKADGLSRPCMKLKMKL